MRCSDVEDDAGSVLEGALGPLSAVMISNRAVKKRSEIAAGFAVPLSNQAVQEMSATNVLAPMFYQVAWVVKDIAVAERFFVSTIGIKKFFRLENLRASDVEGTYRGKPGDWVCHLYFAYAGDTQIELIQHVSGASIFGESLAQHGDAVQHVAYCVDEVDWEVSARRLESEGFPLVQSLRTPLGRGGYFDTRPAIGVTTEIVSVSEAGREFRGGPLRLDRGPSLISEIFCAKVLIGAGAEDDSTETTKPFAGLQSQGGPGRGTRRSYARGACRAVQQFDVHPNQIQDWKKKLLSGAGDVFGEGAAAETKEAEVDKLHEKIGRLTMENDFLAKALGRDR